MRESSAFSRIEYEGDCTLAESKYSLVANLLDMSVEGEHRRRYLHVCMVELVVFVLWLFYRRKLLYLENRFKLVVR